MRWHVQPIEAIGPPTCAVSQGYRLQLQYPNKIHEGIRLPMLLPARVHITTAVNCNYTTQAG